MSAPGERDLEILLRRLDVERRPGVFCYVSRARGATAPFGAIATIDEGETVTYVVPVDGSPDDAVFPCAWLTLTVESSLDAVGLTAVFATRLADIGIPANVLAGWLHDHILVPADQADAAIAALLSLRGDEH